MQFLAFGEQKNVLLIRNSFCARMLMKAKIRNIDIVGKLVVSMTAKKTHHEDGLCEQAGNIVNNPAIIIH